MTEITFTVPAVPIAQPRPRAMVLGGRAVMRGANGSHKVNTFKPMVAMAARQAYSGPPLEGPIEIFVEFVMPRPGNMVWKSRPMPRVWHTKKPDGDNLVKGVKDALSKVLWRDDSQICSMRVMKWVAAGHEQPHVELLVREL